jgi:hypothetical protein
VFLVVWWVAGIIRRRAAYEDLAEGDVGPAEAPA